MWKQYKLEMQFVTPLCGGVPRSDEIVAKWVAVRTATEAHHKALVETAGMPDRPETMPQTIEEVTAERLATTDTLPDDAPEEMKAVWVGFSRDESGLFVRGGNLRAHIKACAETLGKRVRLKNDLCEPVAQFKHKVTEAVYIAEDRLPIYRPGCNGEPPERYTEASTYRDATLSVMTARGPRTCLKRIDMVEPAMIRATVLFLPSKDIQIEHVDLCLQYGCVQGFNQDRSLGFGRYTYTLEPAGELGA